MLNKRSIPLAVLLAAMTIGAGEGPGTINIISSSHQDTAWMDTPAFCREFRGEKNIIPALEMMARDPDYKFSMECMLHLMEFIEAHPERADEVIARTREGRFEWGATYNQPYESWLTGEELVRQIYYGRRWLTRNFPGCDARVAFSPDVPARALQMEQILAKAGVPYLLGSRYTAGLYNWQSPDGSSVIFYSMGHYMNHSLIIRRPPALAAWRVQRELTKLHPYYRGHGIPAAYALLNSMDFSVPRDFSRLIRTWNGPLSPGRMAAGGEAPLMRYATAAEFFDAIAEAKAGLDLRAGERPDVWLYIHGPTHHLMSDERRRSAMMLTLAETAAVIDGLLTDNLAAWPKAEFDRAWMNQLYIDHGIGGKNGHITDVVFSRKLREAEAFARGLPAISFPTIVGGLSVDAPAGSKVALAFNGGSAPATQAVTVGLPAGGVREAGGGDVPWQLTTLESPREVNVAPASEGASASADSVAGPDYGAEKAIDGEWEVGETHPELGPSRMWRSGPGPGPHWLMIDLGQPRLIRQVVIRHYGCIGEYGLEKKLTTADFRVQRAETGAGPWTDLVPAVTGNDLPLTVHAFEPQTVRYLRIFITRGTQIGGGGAARVLEVSALAADPAPEPKVLFLARDVPAVGYKTYVVSPAGEQAPGIEADSGSAENAFYRLALAPGGVKSIYDKAQGRELVSADKWLAGEVFTLLSVARADRLKGTDAGEFGSAPLPVMDASFDRVSNHKPAWELAENGPVRTVWETTAQLADAEVRQRVTLWHEIKLIDLDADLVNFSGRPWREFRIAIPLALDQPEIVYEAPMGVIRIGRDEAAGIGGHAYLILHYPDELQSIHPREVQRFIDASDGRGGVSILTSVAVFDWLDPTGPMPYPVIQPVLLASRKSCNREGNWYPQAGAHQFRFSLTSHPGGWTNGWKAASGGRGEGITAVHPSPGRRNSAASLPPSLSFFSVSAPNVMITAVKKAEDDDDVVVRLVEMEGKDTEVVLRSYFPIAAAARADMIEENAVPIPADEHEVRLTIGHHAIETVKLRLR